MRRQRRGIIVNIICLSIFVLGLFACMIYANSIQTNEGQIEISIGSIEVSEEDGVINESGELTYKLYTPKSATEANKAAAVLLLHGYQNDHETCSAYAIELAKRGVVVMCLDEYGHGSSTIGMAARGYVNHKVTVNYGEDSEEDGSYVEISGQTRYRVMMNFSNLSFFNEYYSTDDDGNRINDSSMGGIAAYMVLSNMSNVDSTRMAVSGHSMGTWASWSVAAAYSGTAIEPKATVIQCGELFRDSVYDTALIHFNNVLLLQAKWDEFSYFRDYKNVVSDELLTSDLRLEFLGTTKEDAQWNKTYGSFADGSARRIELLMTNHRLTTHNAEGIATALEWFENTIDIDESISFTSQTFQIKEWSVFIAMLLAIAAMLPLMELLLKTRFFRNVKQELPDRPEKLKTGWKWWRGAILTMLIAGLTYPFMCQLGHGLMPLPENVFKMTIGNGFLMWYVLLIVVMLITTCISWASAKKHNKPLDFLDLGLARIEKPRKISLSLFIKSTLLATIMALFMYLIVWACELLFMLDLRVIWPFFKTFTLERFLQFLVYIPFFALFFILNNSKIFAQMRVEEASKPGLIGFLSCWWKYALCMVGGILLLVLIEYIPFFLNIGPGADLLFSSTFGGPFMSLLIVFVPQVIVFSLLCTSIYRKTGNIYTGAIFVAILATWIVTGGSAML